MSIRPDRKPDVAARGSQDPVRKPDDPARAGAAESGNAALDKRSIWIDLALVFVAAIWLLGFEIHEHGRTLDDKVQRERGAATLEYVTSLDPKWLPPEDLDDFSKGDRLYGPFGSATALALGRVIAPLIGDPVRDLHFEFAVGLTCWFLLLLFCTLRLGRHVLRNGLLAVLAASSLLALPRVAGLATCNPSDLPAAGGMAFAVLMLVRWIDERSWPRALALAFGLGMTAAIRPQNGALALPTLVAFLWPALRRGVRLPPAQLVAAPFLCFAFWILCWPDFWHAPFGGPISVVEGFLANSARYAQGTLWFGEGVTGPKLYPLVYLGITTPVSLLALALLGLLSLRRHPLYWGFVAWFVISVGKHLSGAGNFGGIRHFLDAFVPFVLAVSAGVAWVTTSLRPKTRRVVIIAAMTLFVVTGQRLRPYQSSYFNALVGGPRGAAGQLDMEPNGASMLQVMRRLAPKLDDRSVLLVPGAADLVHQVVTPKGLVVYELASGASKVLGSKQVRDFLATRKVFVTFVQDRHWGLLDSAVKEGLLREVVACGPLDLPVGVAYEVLDARVYDRIIELFGGE